MKLAIIFWFYKEVDVCENRLQLLKKYNPNLKIYGLYGGNLEDAFLFNEKLGKYLNDFYITPETDAFKKWIHGDLFLLDWYKKRGQFLEWDSIVMAQWDLLALDSFENIFAGIKKDQVYLPHYGLIDEEVENSWRWTFPEKFEQADINSRERPHMRGCFLDFKKYVMDNYGYKDIIPYCIFMVAVLPRIFFEKYQSIDNIELGFLEYKIPTYCKIFGIERLELDLGEKGNSINDIENLSMNAYPVEIKNEYIKNELSKVDGRRLFHPYYKVY